jgi:ketosteroid isomerase-like protein
MGKRNKPARYCGAMSEENVKTVRRWVEAINAGDADALVELADPEVDYLPYLGSLAGDSGYRGHEGLRQYVRDLTEAWTWYDVEPYELRDLGDDVLMVGRLEARGRSSGLRVKEEMAWLHSFREGTGPGRYLRLRFFATTREALEAAGLSE